MGDLPFFCSHPERKVSLEAANLPIIESRALVFFFTLTDCLESGGGGEIGIQGAVLRI